jgi:soluble lytic murein transglycosylase-like protein
MSCPPLWSSAASGGLRRTLLPYALVLAALAPSPARAAEGCLERAAAWAQVHPTLLRAIAWVESRGNPTALSWNANGSYDAGLMQINSWWFHHGLASLWSRLEEPCVNVAAGSWVMKQCREEYGYTWQAVGCYHAGSGWPTSRSRRPAALRYIRRVQDVILRAESGTSDTFLRLPAPDREGRVPPSGTPVP